MAKLLWDQPGDRRFETGVDRGVLYLPNGSAVVWNGLTSVEEGSELEVKAAYLDGMKYLEYHVLGDFIGSLRAFTYPAEFDQVLGNQETIPGMFLHDQRPTSFGLSYRTKIGNDVDGQDHTYRIHLLWGLRATPEAIARTSLNEEVTPTEFGWSLSATPQLVSGHRPAAHISFVANEMDPDFLVALEELIYGTDSTDPELPSLQEVMTLMTGWNTIFITDNGDGTWTATSTGPDAYENIVMVNSTTYQINNVDVAVVDSDEYTITTTILE